MWRSEIPVPHSDKPKEYVNSGTILQGSVLGPQLLGVAIKRTDKRVDIHRNRFKRLTQNLKAGGDGWLAKFRSL